MAKEATKCNKRRNMSNEKHNKSHSETSPLSLLSDAAGLQHSETRPANPPPPTFGTNPNKKVKLETSPPPVFPKQTTQHQIMNPPVQSALTDMNLLQQHAALAAVAQQQIAALALATDIRTAVARAQLQQASHIQIQNLLIIQAVALGQQLGLTGLTCGRTRQQLEDLQRQQQLLLLALVARPVQQPQLTSSALATCQQLQDAQMPPGQTNQDAILNRAGLHRAPDALTSSAMATGGISGTGTMSSGNPPGSVIVPCRARGMPMDHNFKSAYFVIPENVEHGKELICSNSACRNGGIKFRYCVHCKVPVAKRNFRKRHHHGGEKREGSTGTDTNSSLNSGDESGTTSATSSMESYSEWRDRKRHKEQSKGITSPFRE